MTSPGPQEHLSLLIEILSCRDLPIADRKSSDPYVKVLLGEKDLHKTKHLLKTLNPVFSQDTHFATVVQFTGEELFHHDGLVFKVKDWDRFGSNDTLGHVHVSAQTLLQQAASSEHGGKMEYPLVPHPKYDQAGQITLRIQHATEQDRQQYKVATKPGTNFWNPRAAVVSEEPVTTRGVPEPELQPESTSPSSSLAKPNMRESVAEEAKTVQPGEELNLMVEIVSCRDLLAGDKNGLSDPYVKIKMEGEELHRTKHILKTLNPVYDADTSSTFHLKCPAADVLESGGLSLEVKDWDRGFIGGNDRLGSATVPFSDLYSKVNGGPLEYALAPPQGRENEAAGFVTIKCRQATPDDVDVHKKGFLRGGLLSQNTETEAMTGEATEVDGVVVPDEDKEILIEIVAARNLSAADKTGLSDPYVKIKLGGKDLHETKPVLKTVNPAFAVEQKNFFILHCTAKELFQEKGLLFKVKDWDRGFGGNDELGSVFVAADTLYNFGEKPRELKLSPPKGHGEDAGFLTIRCRPPTLGDKESYKQLHSTFGRLVNTQEAEKESPVDLMGYVDVEDRIFLFEIVSCRDLLPADKTGASDPYVKIKMGGKELHSTDMVRNTLNPVYTEELDNAYVLDVPAMELYGKRGISLKVKDWDRGFGGNDDLGSVDIPADIIYNFGPDVKEFKLDPPSGKNDEAGYVSIRCSVISAAERDSRKKGLFRAFRSSGNKTREVDLSDLDLLIEIVSCRNLIKADLNTSDPYVKVTIGGETVHKTENIPNARDPIYTITTGSVFVLSVVKQEFIESDGLKFTVKDYDTLGRNDDLGYVVVSGKQLCEAKGERMVLKLSPPEGSKHQEAGALNLRCRAATNYDKKFLGYATGELKGDFLGLDGMTDVVMKPKGGSAKLIKQRLSLVEKSGPDAGLTKYKVRPVPDPERVAETTWMSKDEIETEALKPSRSWVDIGSGELGKMYVEIVQADGLPNLDISVRGREKSDPFVMLVYEDCCAKTDIIDDCLSPRWLPWMQRAFVFNIDHTSSDLFVGIFDSDSSMGGHHDLVGRFPVEVSGMKPNTEYTLSYNLYEDSISDDRETRGSLTLRIRVEFPSQRQLVLSNLRWPPDEYINVAAKKDYKLVRKVIGGNKDLMKYSLGTITLYVQELISYLYVQYYITDAVISLLFWRGQVPFAFGFKIPLHSMIAFVAAISMAERPSLFFAYFWFAHAWLLLAIQIWRNNTPHPWIKTKSFWQILLMLILDGAMTGPDSIPENYMEREATELEEQFRERVKKAEAAAEKRREEEMKLLAEHEKQMAELDQEADVDIATQSGGMSLDPLKGFLYPIQGHLATVCAVLRFVRNVYMWDEPYFAFYLAATSILVGLVFLVVPWAFLIRWTGRVIAWGVFGPHMKLVDIFYYKKLKEATEEEERKKMLDSYEAQRSAAEAKADLAFIQTEDAVKLNDVKRILYGKWIARVPVIKSERFRDLPLHKSSAKPYEPDEKTARGVKSIRIGGQRLVGNMIPQLRAMDDAKKAADAAGGEQDAAKSDIEATEKTPLLK